MWDAKRIKSIRAKYGETQARFAVRLGVTDHAIQKWEMGRHNTQGVVCQPSRPVCLLLDILEDAILQGIKPRHPSDGPARLG